MKLNLSSGENFQEGEGKRIYPGAFKSKEEYLLYLRHLFAYEFASSIISNISNNLYDDIVLEVGCGEGYGTNLLANSVKKIIGLDIDKEIIEHANRKYKTKNCIFMWYDGIKLPFKDHSFDAVVSFQVIEHVQDDKNFISKVHRVLKTGGMFILTTPNRFYRLKTGEKPWNPHHVREYPPLELEDLLKNKFSKVKIWGIRGNDEVQEIEMSRIKQNLLLTLDRWNLRRFLPDKIKKVISRMIISTAKNKKRDFYDKYSTKDFFVKKENVEDSLDILGICEK